MKPLSEYLADQVLACGCSPEEDEWPDVLAYVRETTKHLEPEAE